MIQTKSKRKVEIYISMKNQSEEREEKPNQPVLAFHGVPDSSKVRWKTQTVDAFLIFLQEVDQFQLDHRYQISFLFTHISPDIQDIVTQILLTEKPKKYPDWSTVHQVDFDDLYKATESHFCPKDIDHFNRLLVRSCSSYVVTQKGESYSTTRLQIYTLKRKFTERYNFLLEASRRKGEKLHLKVPALKFKEGV
jgi:hypothetical protein